MTPTTLYENRPGGTIVRLTDGTHMYVSYGQAYVGEFAPDNLDPLIVQGLSSHADSTPRLSAEDAQLALARQAATRSAQDNGGQVNSSQSPVPGNYGDLDTDGAAILVGQLANYPEQQASVIYHEILFGGNRRKVIDAAPASVQLTAQARIAHLTASQKTNTDADLGDPVASPGDPGFAATPDEFKRASAAQAAQSLKATGPVQAPTSPPASGVSDADYQAALSAAEDAQRQLAELQERIADTSANRGDSGDPISKTDALGWDGKDGPNTEGYWTNDDLRGYAARHQVDLSGATNRDQLKAKLALGGHDAPQTPKP